MSNQLTNQPTYRSRLAALASAAADAVEAAYNAIDFTTDGDEIAYVNLWDALLNALIVHADCDHAELLGVVAGTLQMRLPVPIVGTIENGVVHMDMEWTKHWRGLGGAGGLL